MLNIFSLLKRAEYQVSLPVWGIALLASALLLAGCGQANPAEPTTPALERVSASETPFVPEPTVTLGLPATFTPQPTLIVETPSNLGLDFANAIPLAYSTDLPDDLSLTIQHSQMSQAVIDNVAQRYPDLPPLEAGMGYISMQVLVTCKKG